MILAKHFLKWNWFMWVGWKQTEEIQQILGFTNTFYYIVVIGNFTIDTTSKLQQSQYYRES